MEQQKDLKKKQGIVSTARGVAHVIASPLLYMIATIFFKAALYLPEHIMVWRKVRNGAMMTQVPGKRNRIKNARTEEYYGIAIYKESKRTDSQMSGNNRVAKENCDKYLQRELKQKSFFVS